ncbi:helix-turn-helix domain-containing protein [Mycobacteroides abscessus]|uniref:helix-turn-helix domain-containing protein n=1 Tax=Mycobacteroides abscessus TaxID=36809 RepID=UPI000C25E0E4|nr:helix-turn-helix domain-containing protein [Mycobacteroides abscessus]
MLRSVAALVLDRVAVFEFGVICEVFGIDRARDGVPNFDFRVCGVEPGVPLRTTVGASLIPDHGLEGLADADLVALPARPFTEGYPQEALDAVRAASERGATILTVCSGAFIAGAAGLLDGRRCTTHWMYTDTLARQYPTATVDRDVLFVDDGDLITSAGTAAGIDACLHLVRRELGSEITNRIARRMVVPPQRAGGQRQFIPQPVPDMVADGFGELCDWLIENIDQSHTVAELAARVHMSTRTFARKFTDQTGVTPMRWIIDQRVLRARRLLEETGLDIDTVAACSGFGTAILLRHHFRRGVGITPTDYRKAFAVAAR